MTILRQAQRAKFIRKSLYENKLNSIEGMSLTAELNSLLEGLGLTGKENLIMGKLNKIIISTKNALPAIKVVNNRVVAA